MVDAWLIVFRLARSRTLRENSGFREQYSSREDCTVVESQLRKTPSRNYNAFGILVSFCRPAAEEIANESNRFARRFTADSGCR